MAESVCGPVAEEDEPIVVSVHDKGAVPPELSKPLDVSVGMKDAIGEGKLGAERMDEVEEWNGEGSDGSILFELEGAGRPRLLFSRRLAIVCDICPNLNDRTGVELPVFHRRSEREMAGMKGDVQDRSLAEGWAEGDHNLRSERGEREGVRDTPCLQLSSFFPTPCCIHA